MLSTIRSYPSEFEAGFIKQQLETYGVAAFIFKEEGGGAMLQSLPRAVNLKVDQRDLAEAGQILQALEQYADLRAGGVEGEGPGPPARAGQGARIRILTALLAVIAAGGLLLALLF